MKRIDGRRSGTDVIFCIAVFALSALGLLFIYCASSYSALYQYGDAWYYVKKQAVALAIGAVSFVAVSRCDVTKIRKYAWVILISSYILLGLIFTPLGVEFYGAKRWINLAFFTIQPSEIAKFGII